MCFISGSILATPKCLSISSWNVNGFSQNFALSNKLSNSDFFLRYFNHHDILIFTETWSNDSWTVPGFKSISIPAKKYRTKRHGRLSGGISFCFKTELQKGIAHISSSSDYIWCKLDKTFFNFDQDVFICAIYKPPWRFTLLWPRYTPLKIHLTLTQILFTIWKTILPTQVKEARWPHG